MWFFIENFLCVIFARFKGICSHNQTVVLFTENRYEILTLKMLLEDPVRQNA